MTTARPQRTHVEYPVQFTHEEGVTGHGTMKNLSPKGCGIVSDLEVFEEMLLTLQFVPGEGAAPITIEMARVRWAARGEFGVEFLMILPKERTRLERLLTAIASAQASGLPPSAAA